MLEAELIEREGRAIGERIRKLRVERGFSNAQLAEQLGLSVPAVKKIQHGSACIQFLKLGEICRVLDTEPNHILGFADSGTVRLTAVMETIFETLGVPKDSVATLVQSALEAVADEVVQTPSIDPLQAARVQAYLAARRAMGATER